MDREAILEKRIKSFKKGADLDTLKKKRHEKHFNLTKQKREKLLSAKRRRPVNDLSLNELIALKQYTKEQLGTLVKLLDVCKLVQ